MKETNKALNKAKNVKDDEFYTQYKDVENECKHYKEHFKGKHIYLNCDGEKSEFYKYFESHFEELELKQLTATGYNPNGIAFRYDVYSTSFGLIHSRIDLDGDGDFRSSECRGILQEVDIVVTNPPFSLFREFIDLMVEYDMKYLVLGNHNAVGYKNIFPLIKENKMWLGYHASKGMTFIRPNGDKQSLGFISWFTNLTTEKQEEVLELKELYNVKKYPRYTNYDAIAVNKLVDIPKDYHGNMGVPITYLAKHNAEQFEIIDFLGTPRYMDGDTEKKSYKRFIIKRK